MTWLSVLAVTASHAQVPNTVSVGFKNRTEFNVVVQGFTFLNGKKVLGPTMTIRKGGVAFESNVPPGIRYYTISDAIQFRVLLANQPVPVQNRDLIFAILPHPADPKRVVIGSD